ncbi:MAG: hypothetical protein GC171_12005 [Terrimonas sp.]|nr:hypothetical protein [Terrimonas sp.]
MGYPQKEIIQNFFSVIAGVLIALAISIPLSFLAGILVFSDAPVPLAQTVIANILLALALIGGCLAGGYTTAKISTRRTRIHILITAIVLIYLFCRINDLILTREGGWDLAALAGIILFTGMGAYLELRKKKS